MVPDVNGEINVKLECKDFGWDAFTRLWSNEELSMENYNGLEGKM